MKYPCLVPKTVCKTNIHIVIYKEGISEDGEPIKALEGDFKCNYQDKAKTILTSTEKIVQITGTAYFNGDIAPNLETISDGEVEIFGVKRKIQQGAKARNLDGSVNYTKLDLI